MSSLIDRHAGTGARGENTSSAGILRGRFGSGLMHVHVCTRCGQKKRREEMTGIEIASGIFQCLSCESNGPLNLEICGTFE